MSVFLLGNIQIPSSVIILPLVFLGIVLLVALVLICWMMRWLIRWVCR
jgi:hypothetical protein